MTDDARTDGNKKRDRDKGQGLGNGGTDTTPFALLTSSSFLCALTCPCHTYEWRIPNQLLLSIYMLTWHKTYVCFYFLTLKTMHALTHLPSLPLLPPCLA